MPQMAPSFWLFLMTLTLIIMTITMIKLFYLFFPKLNFPKLTSSTHTSTKNWKI